MRNGGIVLLADLNLYVGIKVLVVTSDTSHSVIGITQTVNRCFIPEASRLLSQVSQQISL
jgi:hypothetical protein